jgi:hypothetical protein
MTELPTPPAIDSRSGFRAALQWGFDAAFAQGARRIVCSDATFADWPLDDAALLQGLTAWLQRPQRRLVLLARSYDDVPRRCPRFNAWRTPWSHAIEAWVAPEELSRDLPTVLVSDGAVSVHLIDAVHWRGRAELDERRARHWNEELDVVLQRSERGFSANTLGL